MNSDGTTTSSADLSSFVKANPVAHPDLDDFEPDGTWYGMVVSHGVFYATEPNSQQTDRITLDGQVTRVVDLSTMFLPPGRMERSNGSSSHGSLYFGQLGTFPVVPGTESIYNLTADGSVKLVASGLTAVLGVAFDRQGRLYALETDTVAGFPGPAAVGKGEIVRVNHDGTKTTIATGLTFPTAMTLVLTAYSTCPISATRFHRVREKSWSSMRAEQTAMPRMTTHPPARNLRTPGRSSPHLKPRTKTSNLRIPLFPLNLDPDQCSI